MYGPLESVYRPPITEHASVSVDLATHCSGLRSGLPLWGASRTFHSPTASLYDLSETVVEIDRTLCKSRARSLSPTLRERQALSYYDFVSDCHAQSNAQKEYLANEFELERRTLTKSEAAANFRNTAMRMHHDEGNRLLAFEMYQRALENDPDNVECLNACGILLDDSGAIAKREMANEALNSLLSKDSTKSSTALLSKRDAIVEAQHIYDSAVRWNNGEFAEPSMYSCMKRNLSKLTPTTIRAFKSLEVHRAFLNGRQSKSRNRKVATWGIRTLVLQ